MTKLIIAINFIVFLLCEFIFDPQISFLFGLNILFYTNDFLWQPLTTMFMHANFIHLAMNMAVLYHFGILFESHFGSRKFILIYIVGGILTSILSFIFIFFIFINSGELVNMIGASGAISMLLGMLTFLDKQNAKGLVIAILLMSFIPILMGVNIAWYAHIIGFGVGYISLRFRLV